MKINKTLLVKYHDSWSVHWLQWKMGRSLSNMQMTGWKQDSPSAHFHSR